MDVKVRREKLNGERRERIIAPVIDALIFRVPLSDGDIVLERRGRETVKVEAVNLDDIGGVFESFLDVTVFKDTIPDSVGAALFVENAFVGKRVFGVEYGIERFVFDLDEFRSVVGQPRGFGCNGGDGFALIADLSRASE